MRQKPEMTEELFAVEAQKILANIPVEFHSYVLYQASDRYGRDGLEEELNGINYILEGLEDAIKSYNSSKGIQS